MRRRLPVALLLAAATVAVYAQVRNHPFVNFDDVVYITGNASLREGLTWAGVWRDLTTAIEAYWLPLTALSLRVSFALHGLAPAGWLLTNAVLHAAAAAVLFLALARMTGAVGRSAFVAACFALHPLHVESVAWATERKDVLSGLAFALALLAYARHAERPGALRLATATGCLVLGLLAKPTLVTLPFVLLLLDWWPLGRLPATGPAARAQRRRAIVEKVPMLLAAATASAITYRMQRSYGALQLGDTLTLGHRLMTAAESYLFYLQKTVWPSGLGVFYPHPPGGPDPWWAVGCAALLAAITIEVAVEWRRRPYLAVGWLWFLGMLVPMIGLVQAGMQARADRFTYLPQTGLAIMVAWGVADLAGRTRAARLALAAGGAAALAALAAVTWVQIGHWRGTIPLFERAVAVTTGNAFAHWRLGEQYREAGRLDVAEAHYRAAVGLQPAWPPSLLGLASLRHHRGDAPEALRLYEAVVAARPRHAGALGHAGMLHLALGDHERARDRLAQAIALQPGSADLHAGAAEAHARLGRLAEAVRHGREALRLDPSNRRAASALATVIATVPAPAVCNPEEAVRIGPITVQ